MQPNACWITTAGKQLPRHPINLGAAQEEALGLSDYGCSSVLTPNLAFAAGPMPVLLLCSLKAKPGSAVCLRVAERQNKSGSAATFRTMTHRSDAPPDDPPRRRQILYETNPNIVIRGCCIEKWGHTGGDTETLLIAPVATTVRFSSHICR